MSSDSKRPLITLEKGAVHPQELSILIRSAGERTEEACYQLVSRQVPGAEVVVIREKPFSAALAKSFEFGQDLGAPWTLCLDADVMLAPGMVAKLLTKARTLDENAFGQSGSLLDKFYGTKKFRGLHLYRTRLLGKALDYVPLVRQALRPETEVKKLMKAEGHAWGSSWELYGIHDYEQYYSDIFRKMVTRAQKSGRDAQSLIERLSLLANDDLDFSVATWALRYGVTLTPQDISLHSSEFGELAQTLLACHGFCEKSPLSGAQTTGEYVKVQLEQSGAVEASPDELQSVLERRRVKLLLWRIGGGVSKIGAILRKVAVKL